MNSKWYTRDDAFYDVAEGIRLTVEEIVVQDVAKQYVDEGYQFYTQRQYPEAITAYEQALQHDPKCFKAYNNKGCVLSDLKRYEEALAAFEQAAQIKPNKAEAIKNMGYALIYLKRYKEAIDVLNLVLKIDSHDENVRNDLSALYDTVNGSSEAQQVYTKTI